MRHVYTEEEDRYIQSERKSGKTIAEIANALCLSESQVAKRIRRHLSGKKKTIRLWSEEEVEILKGNSEKSLDDLDKIIQTKTRRSIENKMRELKLNHHRVHANRVYTYREVFDGSEFSDYFIGLVAADGYVYKPQHKIGIGLHSQDRYLLEEIALRVCGETSIVRTRSDKNMSEIAIYSKAYYEHLESIGIHERKSLTLSYPRGIQNNAHFIRGYFDGDGSISVTRNGDRYKCTLQILGTESLLTTVANILSEEAGASERKISLTACSIHCLRYSSYDDLEKIFHYLYDSSTICMLRKRDKWKNFNDHPKPMYTNQIHRSE